MAAWLWWAWLQIWPNLAANVLWVPLAWAHHVLTRRRIQGLQQHVDQRHEELSSHIATALGTAHAISEEG